ncbi:GNAT family N-acetyltransferase [Enterococcus sp. BWM-S5]|uniref:GNAT family N-acetyltransferase n=1 Tax=Enterococcus larvae TaxID=2794352 RepID=A0ABS4CHD7_9ENTE|nr:GNAT family N-acetyltransferase [Enterococcus larvae]MBP1046038.1 GNAT family N-acetyltransferase [Enterococcus larvae]
MKIRLALLNEAPMIKALVHETIKHIYPHYYPEGAVDFFLAHHSIKTIETDIEQEQVFVIEEAAILGTVTLKGIEICRLFVAPDCQGQGHGRALLDFSERMISKNSDAIRLDASLPSKRIYLNRGYHEVASHCLAAKDGDFLCYDVMEKTIALHD